MSLDAEQIAFLEARKWAVLGTGRGDGSPQLSTVAYVWDGQAIVVSVKSHTAKWKNAKRQPRVCLVVNEDRKQLVVYGEAECIDADPERLELTLAVLRILTGDAELGREDPSSFVPMFDEQQRTVLRIRPTAAFMND